MSQWRRILARVACCVLNAFENFGMRCGLWRVWPLKDILRVLAKNEQKINVYEEVHISQGSHFNSRFIGIFTLCWQSNSLVSYHFLSPGKHNAVATISTHFDLIKNFRLDILILLFSWIKRSRWKCFPWPQNVIFFSLHSKCNTINSTSTHMQTNAERQNTNRPAHIFHYSELSLFFSIILCVAAPTAVIRSLI